MSQPGIRAVTVNHNTSHFVELLARTLLLTEDRTALGLTLTVLDNGSRDEGLPALRAFLDEHGMALEQTGFDPGVVKAKHGEALARYVARHDDCDHFLFLDADAWFVEAGTIATMLRELETAPPGTFACQARILGYYAGRIIEGGAGVPGASDVVGQRSGQVDCDGGLCQATIAPRCSPVCSLVANTPLFRQVVGAFGLAPALRTGVDEAVFYDTFSLMTQVLASHGQRFLISERTVNHFTQATYVPEHRAVKDRDCALLLEALRGGQGMALPQFYESDWVRAQRAEGS